MRKFTFFLATTLLLCAFGTNAQTPPAYGSMLGVNAPLYDQWAPPAQVYANQKEATLNFKIVSINGTTYTWAQTIGSAVPGDGWQMQFRYRNATCEGKIENNFAAARVTNGTSTTGYWTGNSPDANHTKISYFMALPDADGGWSETECYAYNPAAVTVFDASDAAAPTFASAPQITIGAGTATITLNGADNSGYFFYLIKDKNDNVTVCFNNSATFTYSITDPLQDYYIWAVDFSGNASAQEILRTYNPDAQPIAIPENVVVTDNVLTFGAVENAVSYAAYVYLGTFIVDVQENVLPSGSTLAYTGNPATYSVKVQAIADGINNQSSALSAPAAWVIEGDLTNEFCHFLYNPAGNEYRDAVAVTIETQANGAITITFDAINGNAPAFRNTPSVNNIRIGSSAAPNGAAYFTSAYSGNVWTLTPIQEIPQGININYQGQIEYLTNANGNTVGVGNLYPTVNWNYAYGLNCANMVLTPLNAPTNVSFNEFGILTFDEVENAGIYGVYIYFGENLVYSQVPAANNEQIIFALPGTFNVKVKAIPSPDNIAQYSESDFSLPYVYTAEYERLTTIPVSVYCGLEIDDTPATPAGNVDADAVLWKWETDIDNQLVITIASKYPETYTATFRANGMNPALFKINDISTDALLEKVGGNTGNTQTFKGKNGFTLVPGLIIKYSGMVEYAVAPDFMNKYPTMSFVNELYILGSNCNGPVSVLGIPQNVQIAEGNILTFDAVANAVSYKVYVYNNQGVEVGTIANVASGNALAWATIGYYSLKVQAEGDALNYISGELSAEVAFSVSGTLDKPTNLSINTQNQLTFNEVQSVVSYAVYVYQNAADATVLVTLPDFVIGSVVEMDDLPYGTYYVRVQAIGDGDLILDSELSDVYQWTYAEPYDCNLLALENHNLSAGEVYFAPDWTPNQNYTFTVENDIANITLGQATLKTWQAQFRVMIDVPIIIKPNTSYDINVTFATNKNTSVYCKIFDGADNTFISFAGMEAYGANDNTTTTTWVNGEQTFTLNAVVPPAALTKISQILFDFGMNDGNNNITISNISICGEEGNENAVDNVNENLISIYPNPVNDELRIMNYELRNGENVRILDIAGRVIYNSQSIINNSINVSGLANGIYFLNIDNKSITFIKN